MFPGRRAVDRQVCTVLYCTMWGDHGSRGQYDNSWSALRPVQICPLHKAPNVCQVCVFIDGVWQLLATAHVSRQTVLADCLTDVDAVISADPIQRESCNLAGSRFCQIVEIWLDDTWMILDWISVHPYNSS